jgi:hypothetical protein
MLVTLGIRLHLDFALEVGWTWGFEIFKCRAYL